MGISKVASIYPKLAAPAVHTALPIPQSASTYENGQVTRSRPRDYLRCLNLSSLMRARIVHHGNEGAALWFRRHHVQVRLRVGARSVLTADAATRVHWSVPDPSYS
ncbi:hypothetical protein FI667_g8232, partial [Globisporangium splendens]